MTFSDSTTPSMGAPLLFAVTRTRTVKWLVDLRAPRGTLVTSQYELAGIHHV